MNTAVGNDDLSIVDKLRIQWAGTRYDFWLDLKSVPKKQRKALGAELKSNLGDAAADVGMSTALSRLGGLRTLAAKTTSDGHLRSRWLAGWVAGWITLAVVVAAFFILMLYYTEGVLDAGVAEPVSSSLFPFFGSDLTVDPSGGGIAWSVAPGPMPFVSAFAAWLLVAKPWRGVLTRSSSLES